MFNSNFPYILNRPFDPFSIILDINQLLESISFILLISELLENFIF